MSRCPSFVNGASIAYEYDTANRLVSLDNSTGSGHYVYEYAYDKVGNRTSMAVTDSGGTKMHLYAYDKTYQVTEVNYPVGYEYLATDTTFHYDAVGNRTSVIDTGGTTNYTTNALNQYTAVGGVTCLYDASGNMTCDGANIYEYDPENRLTKVTEGADAFAAACDIDLKFTTGGDAAWFCQNDEYSTDHDAAQSGDIGDNQETWLQTTVTGPGALRFDFKLSCDPSNDGLGLYVDGLALGFWTASGVWSDPGPFSITGSGTHTIRWKYIKGSSGSAGSDCLWIDNVRWTGAMPDVNEIEYVYDPSGRRIEKKVDGDTELKFLYDGDHIIAEYDANDTLLRKYVHGPCIDEPICLIESSGTYAGTHYYHYDALGSVVALTDPNGDVVQLYEYGVYGQVAASDPNHPNRFMFTGREFDRDTGLYYYRARYYHPEIGRFLQTDPIGYGDGMNMYRYCMNDPVNCLDPMGLWLQGSPTTSDPCYTKATGRIMILPARAYGTQASPERGVVVPESGLTADDVWDGELGYCFDTNTYASTSLRYRYTVNRKYLSGVQKIATANGIGVIGWRAFIEAQNYYAIRSAEGELQPSSADPEMYASVPLGPPFWVEVRGIRPPTNAGIGNGSWLTDISGYLNIKDALFACNIGVRWFPDEPDRDLVDPFVLPGDVYSDRFDW